MNRSLAALVVDDEATTLRLLRTLLKQIGIQDVEDATDGLDAWGKLQIRRVDLIISDWHMQPMDGFELLQRVRQDVALARTPFLMITAECAPERVAACRRAGASDYIIKPVDAETLRRTIAAVCADA